MNKILLLGALIFSCATTHAQTQIANSDFEQWRSKNEPMTWNSFASAKTTWLTAFGLNFVTPTTTEVNGRVGKGVQIVSVPVVGAKANGNLTTGRINMGSATPASTANHNFTDLTSANHNCPFSGQPDSVTFYATYKRGEARDYTAQATFILHNKVAYKNPHETAANVDRYRVAEAIVPITPASEWTKFSMPLTYSSVALSAEGGYMLASFTTNAIPGNSAGDTLRIDDVVFVYNSRLKSLAYDGVAVAGFSPDSMAYTISGAYDASKVAVEADGRAARITSTYSEADSTLTIRVEGGDVVANATNYHIYTLRFVPQEDVTTAIATTTGAEVLTDVYTLAGQRVRKAVPVAKATVGLPSGIYLVEGQKVVVR